VNITAATTVTATFTLRTYTLTVAKDGNGTGTVESDLAGITCGADCSGSYNYNTDVELTATPTGGSTFAGWSGGGCTGTNATCTVTVTAATTVNATFVTPLTCTTGTTATSCSNGSIGQVNLGNLGATACRTQCETQMAAAEMTSGCWIILNSTCYCRSGTLTGGGTSSGGSCSD
jgi:hypothetical protein